VGLLGIAATSATQGLLIWSILLFPLFFTAGMCLVDTCDGILMLGAYGWAFVHPVRKLYYNMTTTTISIVIAVVVGGIELPSIFGDQFDLHGFFWDGVGSLSDHFGVIGVIIVLIFIISWVVYALIYRLMGHRKLELTWDLAEHST
jgi:nickel/cobalt transporter (NiCoT) family protein